MNEIIPSVKPELEVAESETPLPQVNNGNNVRASWPISLHNLRVNIGHMRPEAKIAIVDCFLWCLQNDVSKADFAAQIGSSDNTIYKVITGKYTAPDTKERLDISDKMLGAMRRWLADQRAKAQLQTDFILTPTAKKVFLACQLAQESRTPVFLFGPSHIGKTWSLTRYASQNNHGRTIYIRIGASSGVCGLIASIAKALGITPSGNRQKSIGAILGGITSDMLVIFDELHELLHTYRKEGFFSCIELIREIHDRTGCGMVLSCTKIKWNEITQYKKQDLEQMFRRGVHRFALGTTTGQPLKEDVKLVLAYYGLDFPARADRVTVEGICEAPYEILHQLSKEEGLKSICERIRYARKFASKANREDLSWEDFVRAHLLIAQNSTAESDWS
jgi:DNA transposition AAA+ family ATPase